MANTRIEKTFIFSTKYKETKERQAKTEGLALTISFDVLYLDCMPEKAAIMLDGDNEWHWFDAETKQWVDIEQAGIELLRKIDTEIEEKASKGVKND